MALRTVVVRFNTNVSTFTADMVRAAHSMDNMARAQARMAASRTKLDSLFNAGFRPGDLHFDAAADSYKRAMDDVGAHHSKVVQGFASGVGKIALVTGAAIGIGLGAAVKHAAEFERQMRDVNAISMAVNRTGLQFPEKGIFDAATHRGLSESEALVEANEHAYKRLGQTILDMSRTSEHGTKDFANTLYDIASAGIFGAKAIDILHQSDIAATAGQTNMKTAAEGLLAVINAYGDAAPSVARINDVLFQTVRVGVIRFEELSHTLGQFVGVAAVAGLKPEEWGAAIATFTRAGIPAAQAGTTLNRVLSSLIHPGTELAKAMKQVGIEDIQTALQTQGLSGVMKSLIGTTGGSVVALGRLFPQFRAARGAFALAAAGGTLYNNVLKDFTDETQLAGAASRAYQENQKSLSYQLAVTKNAIGAAATELGTALLPVAQTVVGAVRGLAMQFAGLSDGAKNLASKAGLVIGGFLLLGGGALVLIPKLGAVTTSLEALGVAEGVAASATLIFTSVLALAAAGVAYWMFIQARGAAEVAKNTDRIKAHVEAMKAEEAQALATAEAEHNFTKLLGLRRTVLDELSGQTGALGNLGDLDKYGATVSDVISASLGDPKAEQKVHDAYAKLFRIDPASIASGLTNADTAKEIDKALTKALAGDKGGIQALRTSFRSHVLESMVLDPKAMESNLKTIDLLGDEMNIHKQSLKDLDAAKKADQDETNLQAQATKANIEAVRSSTGAGDKSREALANQDDAMKELGLSMTDTEGKMQTLTDTQKELNKGFLTFVDISKTYKDAAKAQADSMKGLKDGADVARDSLSAARQEARDSAEKDTAAANDALEQQNRIIDDKVRNQTDDIRDRADKQAQAITDSASGGGKAVSAGATAQAKAIREAANERIEAIEEAARKEKQANSDSKQKASDAAKEAADAVTLTKDRFMKDLKDRAAAAVKYRDDLASIEAKAHEAGVEDASPLLKSLQALGTDGVELAHVFATGTKEEVKAALDQLELLDPAAKNSLDRFQHTLKDRVDKARVWRDNLIKLAASGYVNVARVLAAEGMDGADMVQQAVNMSATEAGKKSLDDLAQTYQEAVNIGDEGYAKTIDVMMTAADAAFQKGGKLAGNDFAEAIKDGAVLGPTEAEEIFQGVEEALKDLDPVLAVQLQLSLDTSAAKRGDVDGSAYAAGFNNAITGAVAQETANPSAPAASTPANAGSRSRRWENNAQGNVVRYFAQGGTIDGEEKHVAQIARASSTKRVWAEPETGGEAYIPLAMSKRNRSTDILRSVAEDFGYQLTQSVQKNANGNIYPPGRQLASGSGGGGGGETRVIVVPQQQPVSQTTKWEFNGPIQGYSLEQVQRDADRKRRLSALQGVM